MLHILVFNQISLSIEWICLLLSSYKPYAMCDFFLNVIAIWEFCVCEGGRGGEKWIN